MRRGSDKDKPHIILEDLVKRLQYLNKKQDKINKKIVFLDTHEYANKISRIDKIIRKWKSKHKKENIILTKDELINRTERETDT